VVRVRKIKSFTNEDFGKDKEGKKLIYHYIDFVGESDEELRLKKGLVMTNFSDSKEKFKSML